MKSIKVLIIDDDEADRLNYKRIFKQSLDVPYEVIEATNAKETLELLKKSEVDCILLDYLLPDTNGLSLLKEIKIICGKFVPVIMLTGQGSEDIAVNSMKAGAADYLIKNKIEPLLLSKTILNSIKSSQLKKIIHQQKQRLKQFSFYDGLTGLVNRQAFEEMAIRSVFEAKRHHEALAIMFIDLDNFKTINDSIGHLAGDEILIETSKRLMGLVPNGAIVARSGDDEFAILITGENIENVANSIARNIIKKMKEGYPLSTDMAFISASIGIACFPNSGHDLNDLLKKANTALTNVKKSSRGTFQFYSDDMNL